MANHGVTVTAETVAEAFEHLYFFEKAAETLLRAYATGKPLSVMTDAVAERTATGWDAYRGMAFAHFDYLRHASTPTILVSRLMRKRQQ
jgi:hypothetical protein